MGNGGLLGIDVVGRGNMRRNRSRVVLLGLLIVLTGVTVWVYWPVSHAPIPVPADLEGLDSRLAEQVRIARENVRLAPRAAETWGELGMVYQANGLPDLAVACYHEAIARQPDHARWWYYQAMAKQELGDHAESLRLLDQVVALDDQFAAGHWRRGLVLYDQGEFDAAEQAFRSALERDPSDPAGWRGLARVLLQQDRAPEAIRLLRQWLGLAGRDQYAQQLLGQAYRQVGETELAEQALRDGGGAKPVWQDAWMFEVVQYGSNLGALMKQARHCIAQGRHELAIKILEPALERHPDDISVLNTLANAYLQVQQFLMAAQLAQRSTQLAPDHFEAHLFLGTALYYQGKHAEARQAIGRALSYNPSSGDAYEISGLLYLEHEQEPDQAIAMFRRAEECEPNDPRYQYRIAMVHSRNKQWNEAAEVLEPVLEKHPTFVSGMIALAMAYTELREFERAGRLLSQARVRDPRDPSLQYAERRLAELMAEKTPGTTQPGSLP